MIFFQNKSNTDTLIFVLSNTHTCIFTAFAIFKYIGLRKQNNNNQISWLNLFSKYFFSSVIFMLN